MSCSVVTGEHSVLSVDPPASDPLSGTSPSLFWNDARAMFKAASLDITVPLPPLRHVNVFADLPLALCERPQHADPDWLLQQPFRTYHVAPASNDSIAITSSSDEQPSETLPLETVPAGHVDTETVIPSVVPTSDDAIAVVAGTDDSTLAAEPPLTRPEVVVNWGNEAIRVISEHLATKDFDAFVQRIAQVTTLTLY